VQVTLCCNSKCSYCRIWKLKDDSQDMSLNNLEKVFCSLRELGVRIVTLTGGEPLIRNDLEEVISLAKHYGMLVEVCTNGMLLTKERVLKLAEAGTGSITLSLDTLDSETYERHRGVPFKFAEQALASLLYIVNEYPTLSGCVNCVITHHNIGKLVPFVNWISEYGGGKILVNLQPYHRSPPISKVPQDLTPKLQKLANDLLAYQDEFTQDDLIPNSELRLVFEKEIEELMRLKKLKPGFPLNNSQFYLKSMPDFLFDNKLPDGFNCVTGYTGIVVRSDLEVSPCWRLPPIGDLEVGELAGIWFSQKYRRQRLAMKHLKCPGCMLLCHREPSWYDWYNTIYKARNSKSC